MEETSNETVLPPWICTFPDFTRTKLATKASYVYSYLSIIAILSFLIIITNSIILIAMILNKKLHRSRYVLILNLCISDLLVGLIFPVVVWGGAGVGDILGSIVSFVSMLTILSIAIERFLKIVLCPYSKKLATSRQLIAVCGGIWLMSAVLFFSVIDKPEAYGYLYHFIIPVLLFIILVVIIVLYLLIFMNVNKQEVSQSQRSTIKRGKFIKSKRVLEGFVMIVALYICCYLPWGVESFRIGILMARNEQDICWRGTIPLYFTICIGILNAVLNPFIYWRRLPDFGDSVKALFKCCCGKYDSKDFENNDSSTTLARQNSRLSNYTKENTIKHNN
ncbi:adenosine receptor A3-like [Antedon mediterranea]|uniref:adenosine receptor A3-like n=1 Tax=Antedon mediterranea TaxID=105859 RepID=UPI003AF66758